MYKRIEKTRATYIAETAAQLLAAVVRAKGAGPPKASASEVSPKAVAAAITLAAELVKAGLTFTDDDVLYQD